MPKQKPATDSVSPETREKLWRVVLQMLKESEALREAGVLVDAMAFHMTKKYKLHLAEGMSWDAFLTLSKYSRTIIYRNIAAAELIEAWAVERYKPSADEPFMITSDMVADFVAARQEAGLPTSIRGIYEERVQTRALRAYLTGEGRMTQEEFHTAMTPRTSEAIAVAPKPEAKIVRMPMPGFEQEELFPTYDNAIAAGYKWDPATDWYARPDGTPMTNQELAEFIDDKAGMLLFTQVQQVLVPARTALLKRIAQFRRYFLAYSTKHRSPKFQTLVKEKSDELEAELLTMLQQIGAMTSDDDE